MKRILFLTMVTTLLLEPKFAANIATDLRSGSGGPDTSDGGYFEIGVTTGYENFPGSNNSVRDFADLVLAVAYRYRGFFVELSQGTYDGLPWA